MKQFKLEVSHATPQQLATIALELKIMSNGWTRHGPRILINGQKLQAPSLRISSIASAILFNCSVENTASAILFKLSFSIIFLSILILHYPRLTVKRCLPLGACRL